VATLLKNENCCMACIVMKISPHFDYLSQESALNVCYIITPKITIIRSICFPSTIEFTLTSLVFSGMNDQIVFFEDLIYNSLLNLNENG
jgi:hypothetical protein